MNLKEIRFKNRISKIVKNLCKQDTSIFEYPDDDLQGMKISSISRPTTDEERDRFEAALEEIEKLLQEM